MNATFEVDLSSAAGKIPMPGSDGNEVELGAVKANEQKFLFSGMDAIHHLLPDVRGVVGQWFLSGFDYMLDLRGKRLEFGKQNVSGKRSLFRPLNGRAAFSTRLGDLVLDSGADRLILFGVELDRRGQSYLRTTAGSQIAGTVSSTLSIEGRNIWRGERSGDSERDRTGSGRLDAARFVQDRLHVQFGRLCRFRMTAFSFRKAFPRGQSRGPRRAAWRIPSSGPAAAGLRCTDPEERRHCLAVAGLDRGGRGTETHRPSNPA